MICRTSFVVRHGRRRSNSDPDAHLQSRRALGGSAIVRFSSRVNGYAFLTIRDPTRRGQSYDIIIHRARRRRDPAENTTRHGKMKKKKKRYYT